jgi:sensor histidine kinase regulating citrate/malate metabolism
LTERRVAGQAAPARQNSSQAWGSLSKAGGEKHMKNRQEGISFIGVLFVVGVLAFAGVIAAQAVPTLIEFQAVTKAANKAKEGSSVPEVRTIFDKAAQIDDIKSITGKDLEVSKEGDKVVVSFAYNKEIHIAGPAYLLLKYTGRTK